MFTYRLRRHIHYLPILGLAAGALFFLPGDESARPEAALAVRETPALPSYVVRLPDPVQMPIKVASIEPVSVPDPAMAARPLVSTAPVVEPASLSDADTLADTEVDPGPLTHATTAVNVRAGPSTSNAKLFVLQPGEPVRMSATDRGWVEVITASGETGWVYSRYLEQGAGAIRNEPTEIERAAIAPSQPKREPSGRAARLGGNAALYAGPSTRSERLFVLEAGERVTVAETDGNWARVVLRSGATGWVRMR